MSDNVARYLLAQASRQPKVPMLAAYLLTWNAGTGENTVIFTGNLEFTNLAYLGNAADLSVGPVLLLLTPGAPVILGRIHKFGTT